MASPTALVLISNEIIPQIKSHQEFQIKW